MILRIFMGLTLLWFAVLIILMATGGILGACGLVQPMAGPFWALTWVICALATQLVIQLVFVTWWACVFVFTGRDILGD